MLLSFMWMTLSLGGDSLEGIKNEKGLLRNEFDMKDMGELRYFLGIKMIHTPEGIWLSQRQYVLDMMSKYGMADCKPISSAIRLEWQSECRCRCCVGGSYDVQEDGG